MDSGFSVDASSGVLGKEGWTLAIGGGSVRGTGSKGSGSTWGWGGLRGRCKSYRESETAEILC